MLKSMMRANALAALLLLCYGAYVVLDANHVFRPAPSSSYHAELIQTVKTESRPEVLRMILLEKLQGDARMQKVNDAIFTRTYQAVGLVAIFASLLLTSNAFALRRLLRSGHENT
jgi:hypothetical protein